jgi:hypothetical protein
MKKVCMTSRPVWPFPGIGSLHNWLNTNVYVQENTVEHYHEEEREQLPLLEAAGFGTKKQDGLVGQCLAVMETSHGHLLPYLLQGLRPHEIHQYLGILQHFSKQTNSQVLLRVSQILSNADEEFLGVWKVAQERVPALAT